MYELKTQKVDEAELEKWSGKYDACNEFAWAYFEENQNVVVKVAEVQGRIHCYVYDGDLDVTIDATLGQFDGLDFAGAWNGEEHPHVDSRWEDEFEDYDEFLDEYDGPHSPFYL